MKAFLDTSVALRPLLQQPGVLRGWGTHDELYGSVLLRVEMLRVVDRLRLEGHLDDPSRTEATRLVHDLCASVHLVPINDLILDRACQSFPTILGTLDAIHLATAVALREHKGLQLTLLTHDSQLAMAARSMNFTVDGA